MWVKLKEYKFVSLLLLQMKAQVRSTMIALSSKPFSNFSSLPLPSLALVLFEDDEVTLSSYSLQTRHGSLFGSELERQWDKVGLEADQHSDPQSLIF